MFTAAIAEATEFTRPVITSRRLLNGTVQAGCATYFMVNADGWALTAAHVVEDVRRHSRDAPDVAAYLAAVAAIEADASLDARHKRKRIDKLQKRDDWIQDQSQWWCADGVTVQVGHADTLADIALVHLAPAAALGITRFARFRTGSTQLAQGTSLCRLGFPFHQVASTFDVSTGGFKLDPGTFPIPRFPLDGILTRHITVADANSARRVQCLEVSTPGLRGQSGGPVFDTSGRVCGMQSSTSHIPLGFEPTLSVNGRQVVEHQFLNLGIAVDSDEILRFLDQHKVTYTTA